jgi:FAD/FMN-containing dehydrogenase/Fe-S oxidoreductase
MVTPKAEWLRVTRINHNLGKIHDQETVQFKLERFKADFKTQLSEPEILTIPGHVFRHRGLGKDVTNKTLFGLPGIQKEGCDGIITSASFVLHRMPSFLRTICLEFFDPDLGRAVPAIIESKNYIESRPGLILAGMEHLDERYVKAVRYSTKAPRADLPKMVLLIDIAGDNDTHVAETASEIVRMANTRGAEGFVAVSADARERFWKDRSRTAAIAAHTNAFKINEDVVIPLENLAAYSEHIERINIELSMQNKIRIIDAILDFIQQEDLTEFCRQDGLPTSEEDLAIIKAKQNTAIGYLGELRDNWHAILSKLDEPADNHPEYFGEVLPKVDIQGKSFLLLLRRRMYRISFHRAVEKPLYEIFSGQSMEAIRERVVAIHKNIRNSRLFVATHMHAGDGNVHTNIPVNSNDYVMLHEADKVVKRIMKIARDLDGVVSGEHGIGITKFQFLDKDVVGDFETYKHKVDPENYFNTGKLMKGADLENAYTPSLRLLQQEALILEASDLGQLNEAVKDCLRCGKCKPVCNTHIPRANLLYSPRNKILATGLIIEAFLYEEQTRRGVSVRHFDEMNDVADHCTVCHKCLAPCPVNIDFGDVSVQMRSILNKYGKKKTSMATRLSMAYLNATDPTTIGLMYSGVLRTGYAVQKRASRFLKKFLPYRLPDQPLATTKRASVTVQLLHLSDKPLNARLPRKTMRQILNLEDNTTVPILRNPQIAQDEMESVFYFPGCGSERLFSEISMATLAMLFQANVQTVLPPGYLCCGYPQSSNGDQEKGRQISIDNQVLFHRIANTLNYLDIKTVIVSCGTCMDQLLKYQFSKIFPGCRLLDIHEYLLEKNMKLSQQTGTKYLYHDPCHTPMKHSNPVQVANQLLTSEVKLSDRCCGEAGTFALNRPDIATQVRYRKQQELESGISEFNGETSVQDHSIKLLTSCPACQQGLSRYEQATGLETKYIVVELAEHYLGASWQDNFLEQISQGGIERVLL